MSLNKVMIIGNLGADPEVRHTQSGATVCNLRVATTDRWTDKSGEKQERTEWHNIVVWGRTAENCGQFLSKGRSVFIEGRIQSSEYTDKDGNQRRSFDIVANTVQFLGGGERSTANPRDGYRNAQPSSGGGSSGGGSGGSSGGGSWGDAPKQGATSGGEGWVQGGEVPF